MLENRETVTIATPGKEQNSIRCYSEYIKYHHQSCSNVTIFPIYPLNPVRCYSVLLLFGYIEHRYETCPNVTMLPNI